MKTVVGVDLNGLYQNALNILGRMQIPNAEVDLIHADQPLGVYPPESFAWTPEVFEMEKQADERILLDASDAALGQGLAVHSKDVLIGSPSAILMDRADEIHADLIAIGSTRKSKYGSFFFGSVGRAIAIGSRHSVLIAKGDVGAHGRIKAIFATDHSKYADEAVLLLARLKPLGFEQLTLVTTLTKEMVEGASDVEKEKFREFMGSKSAEMVEHLKKQGIPADYRVVHGEFDEAIDRQIKQHGAELLIMGAQGHGFLDRLFIGSCSLQQVVATPHSVLVLRP